MRSLVQGGETNPKVLFRYAEMLNQQSNFTEQIKVLTQVEELLATEYSGHSRREELTIKALLL